MTEAFLGFCGAVVAALGLYFTQRMAARSNRRQAEAAAEPELVEKLGGRVDLLYSQVDQLRVALEEEKTRSAESYQTLRVAGIYINDLGRWLWRVTVGPPPFTLPAQPPLPPAELVDLIDPGPWRSLTPEPKEKG